MGTLMVAVLALLPLLAAPDIPALAWTPRSDWISVKPAALGDGQTDDTLALQAGLDRLKDGCSLYLPPGTYRVTRPLKLQGPVIGALLVGHGRDTRLLWDGEAGGRMLVIDGLAYSRVVGVAFDGGGKAAVGLCYDSSARFQTEVRHQHLAFRRFTDAAILRDPAAKLSLAETTFENCLFEDCGRGVAFVQFNDYDYTFDGCEFRRCGTGIDCVHGNFYARNCHFEESRTLDIHSGPEHGSSVRRCTSLRSNQFLAFGAIGVMTIQDCRVEGWKAKDGAIRLTGAPVMLFDCDFKAGAVGSPAVYVRDGQRLFVSGNAWDGGPDVLQPGHRAKVYAVPDGHRKGVLRSASQRFLRSSVPAPGKLFDAKAGFGARGDGKTDDTAALQACIDAARAAGHGAVAYLPTGAYAIGGMLRLTGGGYSVNGSGFLTRLVWHGADNDTMVEVREPQDLALAHIAIGNHDSGPMSNGIDILQAGSERASRMTYDGVWVYGMYQRQPSRKGLHLRNLGPDEVVVMPHVNGNLHLTECARGTILAPCTYEGSVTVDGKDRRRDGFLGFETRLATLTTHALYLYNNHSLVASDFYVEQANNGFVFQGDADDPAGRATIQGPKLHFTVPKDDPAQGTAVTIVNYLGRIFLGPEQYYVEPEQERIEQTGGRAVELYLLASVFYRTRPVPRGPGLKVRLLGCECFGPQPEGSAFTAADDAPADALAAVSEMLDDLRRLGEVDLKLMHPELAGA